MMFADMRGGPAVVEDVEAELLYTYSVLLHGQLCTVRRYGPGSGKPKFRKGARRLRLPNLYTARLELAYTGLPTSHYNYTY